MLLGLEPKLTEVVGCLSIDFNWLRLKPSRKRKERRKKYDCMGFNLKAESNPNLAYSLKIRGDRVDEETYIELEHCG